LISTHQEPCLDSGVLGNRGLIRKGGGEKDKEVNIVYGVAIYGERVTYIALLHAMMSRKWVKLSDYHKAMFLYR
jgi:hypothetical protein